MPDPRVLVVTGSPGVGKSAVLGRIVTTADPQMRTALPGEDTGPRAEPGSVACAVHAKGKTCLDVAMEIARAASAPIPDQSDELIDGLRSVLAERGGARFNLVVDALDEANNPREARAIVTQLLLPIAATCAAVGAQVVVGSRRSDDTGPLLDIFGPAAVTIDLDEPRYTALDDLVAYTLATLQLHGSERPNSPYQDETVARPVAHRIAELAEPNFLVAGLVARTHGLYDTQAMPVTDIAFTPSVAAALDTFVDRLAAAGVLSNRDALTALAFAEAPGFTPELWQTAVRALGFPEVSAVELKRFAVGSAANFLVASSDREAAYRLFHQALADALYAARHRIAHPETDEAALTSAFLEIGKRAGWAHAPGYLFRSLPGHATRAGAVDALLRNTDYVLHADLRRLLPAANQARDPRARETAQLLIRTPQALPAGPSERLALLSMTEALDDTGTTFRTQPATEDPPYRGLWASAPRRADRVFPMKWVNAEICMVRVHGQEMLASADDRTVRIWDPATGATEHILEGHTDSVNAVCTVKVRGQERLVSAASDSTLRIWDPTTGATTTLIADPAAEMWESARLRQIGMFDDSDIESSAWGHIRRVNALCPVRVHGQDLLASAGDKRVWIWDPATGTTIRILEGPTHSMRAVCAVRVQGRDLLASAEDRRVWIWDPTSGASVRILEGHTGWVRAVCAVRVRGRELLAAADDRTVRIWDPTTGATVRTLDGHANPDGHTNPIDAICTLRVHGQEMLASADFSTVRIWDPATGVTQRTLTHHVNAACAVRVHGQEMLACAVARKEVRIWDPAAGAAEHIADGHTERINAVCTVRVNGQDLLASAANDRTVRIWDPATGAAVRILEGDTEQVNAVCTVRVNGQELLASAGYPTVRIWDPATGATVRILEGHTDRVTAVCPVRVHKQDLLVSAAGDSRVRIWNPATGATEQILRGHTRWVSAICPVWVHGRELLASTADDQTVRIWDPATGATAGILEGPPGETNALCTVRVRDRELLACAVSDATVRIWDPATGATEHILEGHTGGVNAVCAVRVHDRDLLASAADDHTVRIWDPATGMTVDEIPTSAAARAITSFGTAALFVGLESGVLAIQVGDPRRRGRYK